MSYHIVVSLVPSIYVTSLIEDNQVRKNHKMITSQVLSLSDSPRPENEYLTCISHRLEKERKIRLME